MVKAEVVGLKACVEVAVLGMKLLSCRFQNVARLKVNQHRSTRGCTVSYEPLKIVDGRITRNTT